MCIGIISEHIGEKHKSFCLRKSVKKLIRDTRNPFELWVICLPYTAEKIAKMKKMRQLALIKKAVTELKKSGVSQFVLTEGLKKYRSEITELCDGISIPDGKEIFYRFVPHAIRTAAKKCRIELLNAKVCISTKTVDRITEYLLREMHFDIKNFIICTDDTDNADMLCKELFEENGFLPQIIKAPVRTDVFIDLDSKRVRVGRNLMIDGVVFDFNLNGYDVNMLDIAHCLTEIDISERVISYKCGKNKLTL